MIFTWEKIPTGFDGEAFHRQGFAAGPVVRRRLPYMRGGMRLVYGFQDEEVSKNGSWLVAKLGLIMWIYEIYECDVLESIPTRQGNQDLISLRI